jgi:hypothetical protein
MNEAAAPAVPNDTIMIQNVRWLSGLQMYVDKLKHSIQTVELILKII